MIHRPTLRQRRDPVGSTGPLRCVLGHTHHRLLAGSPPHSLQQAARTKAGGFAWVLAAFWVPHVTPGNTCSSQLQLTRGQICAAHLRTGSHSACAP